MQPADYHGRFAPSPTGPLHFGSLLAAMASYCDARAHGGSWYLRIDNIDPPREQAGSVDDIIKTLQQFGFEWDADVIYQSERIDAYQQALHTLNEQQLLYECSCTRKSLQGHTAYPGVCRNTPDKPAAAALQVGLTPVQRDTSLRVRITGDVSFEDQVQGTQLINLDSQCGDPVVLRRDGLVAYALACAVDDATKDLVGNARITHVVRGCDLLPATATQIAIMQALKLQAPVYTHIPIAVNSDGQKLSKQTKATPLAVFKALDALELAWQMLGQSPITATSSHSFWPLAFDAWKSENIPRVTQQQFNLPVDGMQE